jgi:hypothetical protein
LNAPATNLATLRNPPPAAPAPDLHVDFFSRNGFELACRIAKAYASSDAVPSAFRSQIEKKEKVNGVFQTITVENPAALGNCLVAIEVSNSVGLSITSVMQNADVINGKLRWSSKFQIGAVNASRRFSPLRFNLKNLGRIKASYREKQGWNKAKGGFDFLERSVEIDNWECVAWAYILDARGAPTAEVVQSIPVSMKMAVEEGWYSKDGSKWQGEMRFQMLQYRAGTFFAGIYAPDVIMGMGKSIEDYRDAIDVTQQDDGVFSASPTLQELRTGNDASTEETVDKETGEITPPAAQIEHQPPAMTIPQQTIQKEAEGALRQDQKEEAAIREREMEESGQPSTGRRIRQRGLDIE